VTRRPRSRVSRTVLAGGKLLQRYVTTREPAPEHLQLACTALARVVELEQTHTLLAPAASSLSRRMR
jgi:hypothetical protein